MKVTYVLLMIVVGFVSTPLLAQSCNSKIIVATPSKRFYDNQDGSVTDKLTGLQWARCSLGQVLENDVCRGEAHQLPWAIVSLVIEKGWRPPTITELNSMVELSCVQPAINATLFPNTISAAYWTATRFISTDGNYWQVNFLHGESTSEPADTTAYVRLVRDEP